MGFHSRDPATPYTPQEGDTLEKIARRETPSGNPATAAEIALFNWGTDDPEVVNEILRDELGCYKRGEDNRFQTSSDCEPRSELLLPQRFEEAELPIDQVHTIRVRKQPAPPPQFEMCARIRGIFFETDKSFIRPSVVGDLKRVEEAMDRHPGAKALIFGHTDKVGSEQYNRDLSERRSLSPYAFITDDADTWEMLYNQEDWGTRAIQEIPKDFGPPYDPGPVDGIYGSRTRAWTGLPCKKGAVLLFLLAFEAGPLAAQERGTGTGQGMNQPPGIQLELGYAADLFQPVRGGLSRDGAALDNLDLLLHLSLSSLVGLRGTSIRIQVQSNRGSSLSEKVGDLQGVSNLEASRAWRLYEAWIAHQFGSPRLSILAGVYDVNAEFDVLPGAGDFVNSSFGFGPEYSLSGVAGPVTFPTTGLAARMKVEPLPFVYGLLSISDGVPGDRGDGRFSLNDQEGALLSFEVGYARPPAENLQTSAWQLRPGGPRRWATDGPQVRRPRQRIGRGRRIEDVSTKAAIGGWVYTHWMEAWTPGASPGRSWGLYLLGEQLLHVGQDGVRGISGFARVGAASSAVNRLDLSVGGGLVYRGVFPDRPDDVLGIGITRARNGSPFLRARHDAGVPTERTETVVELTYRAELGGLLVFQPDLQWVRNPGMHPAVADAFLLGLRAHLLLTLPGSATDS